MATKKGSLGKVILVILFFPIFLIWLVWTKTDWKSYVKGFATAAILLFSFGVLGAAGNPQPAPKPNQTNTINKLEKNIPKQEVKEEKLTEVIPFDTQTKDDSSLASGTTRVQQEGVNGEKQKIFRVIFEGNKEVKRELISENVIKVAVPKIVLNGTYVRPQVTTPPAPKITCDPNYSPCIPNVSYDLDCGDVGFTVQIIGIDRHRFDRDKDGYGCE